jgi:hypothetical protein
MTPSEFLCFGRVLSFQRWTLKVTVSGVRDEATVTADPNVVAETVRVWIPLMALLVAAGKPTTSMRTDVHQGCRVPSVFASETVTVPSVETVQAKCWRK